MGQDTLLHGETLFVVPTTDSDHITLEENTMTHYRTKDCGLQRVHFIKTNLKPKSFLSGH